MLNVNFVCNDYIVILFRCQGPKVKCIGTNYIVILFLQFSTLFLISFSSSLTHLLFLAFAHPFFFFSKKKKKNKQTISNYKVDGITRALIISLIFPWNVCLLTCANMWVCCVQWYVNYKRLTNWLKRKSQ